MRKFFALALAVAMVLSLASVSFAAPNYSNTANVELVGPYRYDSDNDVMVGPNTTDKEFLRYGEGTYYLITIVDDYSATTPITVPTSGFEPVTNFKNVEKLKAKAEFEMGE
ncbi:MAG: hypothetical protein J6A76_04305, partial [Oscillospiraceae bacterium]|nr:hypothetical protein [Oscillospiraceae bacterium]